MKRRVIGIDEDGFPGWLRQVPDCPERLYIVGNGELLKEKKIITVVGSREMSPYGKRMVQKIIPELVREGWLIVSGMAFGVDTLVEKTCIESGGKTIAVLASGADIPSPKSNRWIYEMILKSGGTVVSEQEWGSKPNREDFLKRNRIMAGLGRGTLVVEGGFRSGTLVTAKLAVGYGREVYCVPGRIEDVNSWTPNYLIKNGAVLYSEIGDICL